MIHRKRMLIAPSVLLIAALACNAPATGAGSPSNTTDNGPASTITALAATIEAQGTAGANTDTPLAPTDTATVTQTPTPSVPMVSVSQTTNCRTGPGTVYDLLGSLVTGQSAQVVGKYSAMNYWIINTPGSSGTCWLWGQYATVSGNTSGLPEMIPPPTPTPAATATPAAPADPSKFKSSVTCGPSGSFLFWNVQVVLTWVDNATNEDGYHLSRNGTLLVTLATDSITYTDNTSLAKLYKLGSPPPSISYSIDAFNSAGKSGSRSLSVTCP